MKFFSILFFLPMLGSAFHAPSTSFSFSHQRTYLNAASPAKDCYESNPLVYNAVDESGEVKELFNPEDVFKKATEMDYSNMPINDDQSDQHCVIELLEKQMLRDMLHDYEVAGRFGTGWIAIDVRDQDDIDLTGKFSEHTVNFPFSKIKEEHPFMTCHDDLEWMDKYGFEYPEVYEQFIIMGKKDEAREAANYLKYNYYGNPKMYLYTGGAEEYFFKTPPSEEEYEKAKEVYKEALAKKLDEE